MRLIELLLPSWQLTGLSGGVSRAGQTHQAAFEPDQLYHLGRDPGEQKNLAGKPEHALQLKQMMQTLTTVLEGFPDHPYGELFPGGDTTGREEETAQADSKNGGGIDRHLLQSAGWIL